MVIFIHIYLCRKSMGQQNNCSQITEVCVFIAQRKFLLSKLILSLAICIVIILGLNVDLHKNHSFSFNYVLGLGLISFHVKSLKNKLVMLNA